MKLDRVRIGEVSDNPTLCLLVMAGRGRGAAPSTCGRRELDLVVIGVVSGDLERIRMMWCRRHMDQREGVDPVKSVGVGQ